MSASEPTLNEIAADVQKTWAVFREELDGVKASVGETAEQKAAFEKLNERLDAAEQGLADMQTKTSRPEFDRDKGEDQETVQYQKAFGEFLRKGSVSPELAKSLSRTDDRTGGYLAPSEMVKEIIKGETDYTPVGDLAYVRNTTSKSVQAPKRTGQFAATRVGEGQTRSETDGLRYGQEEIHTSPLHALVIVSLEDLEDSAFDLEAEIIAEAAEQFGVKTGTEFVSGTGANGQAEGFLVNSDVASVNMGSSSAVLHDGLVGFLHGFKRNHFLNFKWAMNLKTLGECRKVKDDNNNPIYVPMALDTPATLIGKPYEIVQEMPDLASGTTPIAGGNFKRGYWWVNRVDMQVQRLVEAYASSGQIGFQVRARNGGQVVLAEAIKKLNMA